MTESMSSELFELDVGGTDFHAWRLRAEPCLESTEIGEFHHGDKICAVRSAAHPGWLRLVDKPGWVKEAQEENIVWKLASAGSPSRASFVHSPPAAPETKSCKDACDCSAEPSSGSTGSSSVQDFVPKPFLGAGRRLEDSDYALASEGAAAANKCEGARWFTGQSHRLSFVCPRILAQTPVAEPREAALRWADMVDDSEEDADDRHAVLKQCCAEGHDCAATELEQSCCVEAAAKTARRRRCRRASAAGRCAHGRVDCEGAKSCATNLLLSEVVVYNELPPPEAELALRHPRRHARNKNLLQKRNKTQLCKYLVEDGVCPFSDGCWFAHSVEELQLSLQLKGGPA